MQQVGGQAVIEGVMMRSPKYVVTAVRKPTGEIVHKKEEFVSLTSRPFLKLPFIRGVITLFESMIIGVKSLNYSANESVDENEAEETQLSTFTLIITLIFSFAFAIALFKLVPLAFVQLLKGKFVLFDNKYVFNLVEGVAKMMLFVAYILVISSFKDVKRIFQYHGAEHKAVNCFEQNEELTLENVKQHSTLHKRCGTSFILFVFFVSILVYLFIPTSWSYLYKSIFRILLLPVIAGVSYEILKLSSKFENSRIFAMVIFPGLALQRLTTKEPDDDQIEVAIHSLKHSLS